MHLQQPQPTHTSSWKFGEKIHGLQKSITCKIQRAIPLEITSRVNDHSAQYQTNTISAAAASALLIEDCARRSRYKVGIICALPKEPMAVRAVFDETRPGRKKNKDDTNMYAFGKMGHHDIIATCLAEYGINSAAVVAVHMKRSFRIRFCLLVGIDGGVPSAQDDICLGDVVVGKYIV
ncbi:hypothetical protein FVEG_17347 [Fusarium verticillioides 7600]|uniref:Nucleoside phosphorylase domain-containing protein n=1 Tax=Gibberella moniliformis (strain M3125 / FGSC 7600) TaxID=334819 RepID=W7N4Q8_GIBM7|nr:hypothetical protein FVEG_17347 [Fusarium verticillioides 7600]EWG54629.1 hypothetical protein FVEG_17347 [Fusarium verticillioides 7600]RBQ75584.1 hypothetical protein FVER14953_20193 [Fusarium verticillioides]RBQ82120.1 hypothetical protein FVER53263_20476 [Fusarium verticillioides]RBR04546.1 hypothetical protein FVER53590_25527 [Fusarium verticillioides]